MNMSVAEDSSPRMPSKMGQYTSFIEDVKMQNESPKFIKKGTEIGLHE